MADTVPIVSVPIRITIAEPPPSDDVAEVSHSSPAETPPEEVTAEIRAVIETAAAVFLAKNDTGTTGPAPGADAGSWTHQGRDIVQASHNLVQRGH